VGTTAIYRSHLTLHSKERKTYGVLEYPRHVEYEKVKEKISR
jgi:hypothetical protein